MKTIKNPFYKAGGKSVALDLDATVLHTQNGERITENYLDSLADYAELEKKSISTAHPLKANNLSFNRKAAEVE